MPPVAVLQHAPVQLDPSALRRARQAAGYTLGAVAVTVGRDLSVVAKYERGEIDPPASVLGALAGLYRVQVSDFYTGGDR